MNETPVLNETPALNETPLVNETLSLNETPALNETPLLNETPVWNETPVLNETPVFNETPALDETPVLNETQALNETPALDETPALNESWLSQEWFLVDITADPRFNVTFVDSNNDTLVEEVRWLVPFVGEVHYELELTIIDVQSYPTVGGNWTVRFLTAGAANLTIRAVNGTEFAEFPLYLWRDSANLTNGTNLTSADLSFLGLRCGGQPLDSALWVMTNDSRAECLDGTLAGNLFANYSEATNISCFAGGIGHDLAGGEQSNWTYLNYSQLRNTTLNITMSGVFVRDYNCTGETSYHTVRVLTEEEELVTAQ